MKQLTTMTNPNLQWFIDHVQHEDRCSLHPRQQQKWDNRQKHLDESPLTAPYPQSYINTFRNECTCPVSEHIKALEGMVLVPELLTRKMIDAGNYTIDDPEAIDETILRLQWKAMIEAVKEEE